MVTEKKPSARRRLTRWVAVALLLLFLPIFVFGATVAATGTVTVSVQEKGGTNLWIPVPALLLDLAILAAPSFLPEDEMAEARRQLEPYRESLETMAEELENMPSGSVLVEVENADEHVLITKNGRSFDVHVEADGADIKVSVPARLVGRSLDLFG